jgi:MFS transporter, DHA2 family, multidrug resistance protein
LARKRLLIWAVLGFTSASFLCGLAPNLPALIVFRILQGASGGCLQPLSQAVMLEAFPPQDRGKAMAFWGFGIVVAAASSSSTRRLLGHRFSDGRDSLAADRFG